MNVVLLRGREMGEKCRILLMKNLEIVFRSCKLNALQGQIGSVNSEAAGYKLEGVHVL